MKSIDELKSTHSAYKEHSRQASYLYKSYIGGNVYRNGNFLTKYINEDNSPGDNYHKRLMSTPLDNHVASTVDIYRSFLFREQPKRELGVLYNNPLVEQWIMDTDQEGQDMDSFLKSVNDLALVMGNMWILVDKPSYAVETQAQEIALGIRAYAAAYSPVNVLDWYYERNVAGKLILEYIKVVESQNSEYAVVTCWHTDRVEKYWVSKNDLGDLEDVMEAQVYENPLGYIPFINHAPNPAPTKGIGYSMLADVADAQRFLYNCASEIEQTIRISSHPTLVKTPSTDASAGAGAIITMGEDIDPALKPYLLQPNGSTIDGILNTMRHVIDGIQRNTHTSAIQAVKTQASGLALTIERQLLNAKLSDLSDTLSETERRMWMIWFDWQGMTPPADFQIEYADSFDIRDRAFELELLIKARSAGLNDPAYIESINRQLATLMVDEPDMLNTVLTNITQNEFKPHLMFNPSTGESVMANTPQDHQTLLEQGFVNA